MIRGIALRPRPLCRFPLASTRLLSAPSIEGNICTAHVQHSPLNSSTTCADQITALPLPHLGSKSNCSGSHQISAGTHSSPNHRNPTASANPTQPSRSQSTPHHRSAAAAARGREERNSEMAICSALLYCISRARCLCVSRAHHRTTTPGRQSGSVPLTPTGRRVRTT